MSSYQNHAEINRILALDVGGSFIKSALFEKGQKKEELPQIPSCSNGSAEDILLALQSAIQNSGGADAAAISIPGPFDYRNGISLMTHKFQAIKDLNLSSVLGGMPVKFLHDANAFLLGELAQGAANGCRRACGITLGTGIGAAVWIDGQLQCNDLGSPSPQASLWSRPYRGGIVEDAISTRALLKKSGAANGKELAKSAKAGDRNAREIWAEFGADLAAILTPYQEFWQLETIVFGGQLSNDFELFGAALKHLPVQRSVLGSSAALFGAAALWDLN